MGKLKYSDTFLSLSTGWRCVVSFTNLPLYSRGNSPRYPVDRRLGGAQNRLGIYGEEKSLTPTGNRIPVPLSSSPNPIKYTETDQIKAAEMDGTSSRHVADKIRMQYFCCETW
jgi:hypothetical protein